MGYVWVVVLRMAFLVLCYVRRCCFQIFWCLRGRKPPCWCARCVMIMLLCAFVHVLSTQRLSLFMMPWNLSRVVSHFVSDICVFCSVVVRSCMSMLVDSLNRISSFCIFSCVIG